MCAELEAGRRIEDDAVEAATTHCLEEIRVHEHRVLHRVERRVESAHRERARIHVDPDDLVADRRAGERKDAAAAADVERASRATSDEEAREVRRLPQRVEVGRMRPEAIRAIRHDDALVHPTDLQTELDTVAGPLRDSVTDQLGEDVVRQLHESVARDAPSAKQTVERAIAVGSFEQLLQPRAEGGDVAAASMSVWRRELQRILSIPPNASESPSLPDS